VKLSNEIKTYKTQYKLQNETILDVNTRLKSITAQFDQSQLTIDKYVILNTRLENELLNIREEHEILLDILNRDSNINEIDDLLQGDDNNLLNSK